MAHEREVAEAMRQLRIHLGESQQQFSNRLGVTVRTVARYETQNPPKRANLIRLADLANSVERHDLASIFKKAEETEHYLGRSEMATALSQLRWALRYTQQELAEKTGLAVTSIARYETNSPPSKKALAKLAELARAANLPLFVRIFEGNKNHECATSLNPSFARFALSVAFNDFLRNATSNRVEAMLGVLRPEIEAMTTEEGLRRKLSLDYEVQRRDARELFPRNAQREERKRSAKGLAAILRRLRDEPRT